MNPGWGEGRILAVMAARASGAVILSWVVACAPAVVRPPAAPVEVVREVRAHACDGTACWQALARAAVDRGDLDVAAVVLEQAYRQAPGRATHVAWVDALLAVGATSQAQRALAEGRDEASRRGEDGWLAEVLRREAELPVKSVTTALWPEVTEARRAAYAAWLDGRADAADAFAALGVEPYDLVHAGELAWARGDERGARVLWARARAGFAMRGATVEVGAIGETDEDGLVWFGERLARFGEISEARNGILSADHWPLNSVQLLGAGGRRMLFDAEEGRVFAGADGRTMLRALEGRLSEVDVVTGIELRSIAVTAESEVLEVSGAGEQMRLLVRDDQGVALLDAHGVELTRLVPGVWSERPRGDHGPVFALGPEARWIAAAGQGIELHALDRGSGAAWTWSRPWVGEPGHWSGTVPAPREPVALRISPAGDELVVVDNIGEVTTWALPGGRLLRRVSGRCSRAELALMRAGDEEPKGSVTADFLDVCGYPGVVALSPDGKVIAGAGDGLVRVRDTRTGARLGVIHREWTGDAAFSSTGRLAIAGDQVEVWQAGARRWTPVPSPAPEFAEPLYDVLQLSADGRRFAMKREEAFVSHDLVDGTRHVPKLGPGESVYAAVDGGQRVWVRGEETIYLRTLPGDATLLRVPVGADRGYLIGKTLPPGYAMIGVLEGDVWAHHIVDPQGHVRVVRLEDFADILSPDARHLAGIQTSRYFTVWSVESGARVLVLPDDVFYAVFSSDGSKIAWWKLFDIAERVRKRGEKRDRRSEVHVVDLRSPGRLIGARMVDRWVDDVAFASDGAEVLLLSGHLVSRWSLVRDGRSEDIDKGRGNWYDDVVAAGGGATLMLSGGAGARIDIVRNDGSLQRLASVIPLENGEWLALSEAGAVDGSPGAVSRVVARVDATQKDDARPVFGGRFVWDGARVRGLVPRALMGEIVAPPGLLHGPTRASGR